MKAENSNLERVRKYIQAEFSEWVRIGPLNGIDQMTLASIIPENKGVYLIGLQFGDNILITYVGMTTNIYARFIEHFFNPRKQKDPKYSGPYKTYMTCVSYDLYPTIHISYCLTPNPKELEERLLSKYNFMANKIRNTAMRLDEIPTFSTL